jgi:uncharacterized membrane protein YeaQ/YmgE (transglycosylase-associated protein family)
MKNFIFILKTTGISLLISLLIGLLVGVIWEKIEPTHAHGFPAWFVTTPLAALTSVLAGVIIGSILSAFKKTNLVHSTLYTIGFVVVVLAFFIVPLI